MMMENRRPAFRTSSLSHFFASEGITADETITDKATQAPTIVPMLWLFRQILARYTLMICSTLERPRISRAISTTARYLFFFR